VRGSDWIGDWGCGWLRGRKWDDGTGEGEGRGERAE